jgi:beta-phosphoglucomutase-like phosphatase (HAD superfamily)
MDGVIIDSEPLHQECERMIFGMLGITVTQDQHNYLVGATDETIWSGIVEQYQLPFSVQEIIRLKKSLYLDFLKKKGGIRVVPYAPELIAGLVNHNYLLALATSSPREQVDFILGETGFRRSFQVVVSGDDIQHGKPHPEIFLKAAGQIGIKPGSCVVIEDSNNGVSAAKSAGMKCIGFKNPVSGIQDLGKADIIVHSLEEIATIFNLLTD